MTRPASRPWRPAAKCETRLPRWRVVLTMLSFLVATATPRAETLLPVQQLASDVWAAGSSARFDSANCGWVRLPATTLLIDVPHGIGIPEFLALVEKHAGRPAGEFILTHADPADGEVLGELRQQGLRQIPTPGQRGLIPGIAAPAEFIPYHTGTVRPEGAIYFRDHKILFGGLATVNGPRLKLPGSDLEGWLSALADLRKIPAAEVVPGFGSWGGASMVEREQCFLSELRRQVAYKIAMAIPPQQIEKEILIPAGFLVWMPYDTPTTEDIRHLYHELTVPRAPFHGRPPEKPDKTAHALVLIGDRFHEPGHLEDGLRRVFEATGVEPHFLFDPCGLSAENLSHVQLLVILRDGFVWPEGNGVSWMTPQQQQAVVDFVESGGAFLNLHNSMGLYPENGPYLKLAGGRYIGHGPLERFWTEVVDPSHPITRGVTNFFCADEQHTPPCDTNRVHLLLRNRSEDGKVVAAAGWAYEPGKGRFCHLANGHTREALNHPMFQRLMENAVNWCLRREAK